MVCFYIDLFDNEEADQVAEITVEGSLEVRKYDSETIEKMQG